MELIGNEAVWYLREVLKEGVYGKDLADEITRECLRYLYRLLFLFYVEAREELGYAPMKSDEYRTGYSLESLRDAAETGAIQRRGSQRLLPAPLAPVAVSPNSRRLAA